MIYQEFSRNVGDIKVSTGQTVKKGQFVGNFTSSHLHLGMTKKDDGTWFNPIPILQGGSTPTPPNPGPTNVHYDLHVLGGSWLRKVTNFNNTNDGFVGYPNRQHDMFYIKVGKGEMKYRVHTAQSGWLAWINKGNKNDTVNCSDPKKSNFLGSLHLFVWSLLF